jgi:hypothetical protein
MIDWLPNEKLRSDVKKISSYQDCITSLFQGLPVNDYDVYIGCSDQTGSAYTPGTTTHLMRHDGRKREDYLNNIQSSFEIDDNESEEAVRYKHLN